MNKIKGTQNEPFNAAKGNPALNKAQYGDGAQNSLKDDTPKPEDGRNNAE